MSFNDLERGQGGHRSGQTGSWRPTTELDEQFSKLTNKVSLQIFKLNGNTTGISKLIDLLGTNRDTPAIRKKLHNLTDVTRDLVKTATDDIRKLASIPIASRQQKIEQTKVSTDFQTALLAFQRIQKLSADRQRHFVDRARANLNEDDAQTSSSRSPALTPKMNTDQLVELEEQRPQLQQQAQVEAVPDSEVEFQEQLIEEREGEIREIESGIHELNEIFRDLGTIVHEQQSMLDNIESNVENIATDTERAAEELTTAHKYQKKAGRRMLFLLLVFGFVLAIIILAALS